MLWIEQYRPASFDEILGQDPVISRMRSAARTGSLPHLLITGPAGTGKSAAVECLARELFGERSGENTTTIQVSDLFEQGKKYLEGNERYAHIFRKEESLLTNFKNITRWYASVRPLDAEFRLLIFEGASALPREAQQGLRRIMERYSRTCRFIYVTTRSSGIIPAISSRCLPFFFSPLSPAVIEERLQSILSRECPEGLGISTDEIELIVQAAGGDLRKAIMLLEVSIGVEGGAGLIRWSQTETGQIAQAALAAIEKGDLPSAIRKFETLMIEYGLTSRELLSEFRIAVRKGYHDPRLVTLLAETDYRLTRCNNEYIQLNSMAARIAQEIFG
ncbi:MAG: AAA family ATPase [Methanomicrobiales archaeon]|nr:AAA family ATPase [Methanomicrobiales archaeon]NYT20895.1 AAA family ATPase [Methanomicrobiales archaeon]